MSTKTPKTPMKCARRAGGTPIDTGGFASKFAKVGDGIVQEALVDKSPSPLPLHEDDIFTRRGTLKANANVCPRTKGGEDPKCRVQLTTAPGGDTLALRLCTKTEQPGFMVSVRSAKVAQEIAREYCACKDVKPAEMCAAELQAKHGGGGLGEHRTRKTRRRKSA